MLSKIIFNRRENIVFFYQISNVEEGVVVNSQFNSQMLTLWKIYVKVGLKIKVNKITIGGHLTILYLKSKHDLKANLNTKQLVYFYHQSVKMPLTIVSSLRYHQKGDLSKIYLPSDDFVRVKPLSRVF